MRGARGDGPSQSWKSWRLACTGHRASSPPSSPHDGGGGGRIGRRGHHAVAEAEAEAEAESANDSAPDIELMVRISFLSD